ncbi:MULTISPECIES: hypothetical protein [Microbacterium]|uniref:Gram-positive cocci surface proteins LPxTG domain-containing protein n=1 Tax=Microbacterium saccharophilum TaxID=1213358 RepID=A0A7Z7D2B0_9MICO|nr:MULTISPECIES: hypothetical protein [Microbacterium]SFI56025.1 hypothetical protein SAMN04487751_2123 [Microbacterium saccharophilum]
MRRLTRFALAAAVVVGSALALPQAAVAAGVIYPPSDACSVSPSAAGANETLDFSCGGATFGANETVTITVTGENGAGASFAFVKFAVSTGSTVRTSTATGALAPVSITLPSNASGVYNIEAISATSAGGVASATVAADGQLPVTGGDSTQLLGLWIGGGALVVAGAAIAIATAVRRSRRRDS